PRLSRLGSRWAPWSNRLAQSRLLRTVNEWWLGIDRRRVPPAFAGEPFTTIFQRLTTGRPPRKFSRRVLLFPDTFTNYYEPAIGCATIELLERLDCETVIADDRQGPGLRCCGRPLISNGLLAEAVECARANVDQLFPWAEAGQAITACEPSCLLTIKDDYPAL